MYSLNDLSFDDFVTIDDHRGKIIVGEVDKEIRFNPKRIFFVRPQSDKQKRGGHAHRISWQMLMVVKGSCVISVDDGENRQDTILKSNKTALTIPPGLWSSQLYKTKDTILMVASDMIYDEGDYIRDYQIFKQFRNIAN